jgi:hypothetical protein
MGTAHEDIHELRKIMKALFQRQPESGDGRTGVAITLEICDIIDEKLTAEKDENIRVQILNKFKTQLAKILLEAFKNKEKMPQLNKRVEAFKEELKGPTW